MKKILLLVAVLLLSLNVNAQNIQWASQTSGVTGNLVSVSAIDDNTCWIAGDDGTVLRTINGGTTWTNVGSGSVNNAADDIVNICAVDANTCLAASYSASATYVYRTTNGGTSWTQVFTQTGGFMDCIWMTSATDGFMNGDPVGSRWSLWKTTNGGASWDSTGLYLAQAGTETGWNNGVYINGSNIWMGTSNSRVYYSSDNGTSWTSQATTGQTNSYCVWFNGTKGFAGGATTLAQTTNSGTNWTMATAPGASNVFAVIGKGDNWLYTRGASIYGSTDNGVNWARVDSVTGAIYYGMNASPSVQIVWAAGASGAIRKGIISITPVELTSFTATNNNGKVVLNWATATETNNKGFEIEKKSANGSYATIGFVGGKGTTTLAQSYTFTDNSVNAGKYSYRLKQVDFNGTFEYSNEVEATVMPSAFSMEQNYPNPFNPSTIIRFNLPETGNVRLAVYNLLGQEIALLANGNYEAGTHEISFNASKLSSGAYFYKIENGTNVEIKKMLLTK